LENFIPATDFGNDFSVAFTLRPGFEALRRGVVVPFRKMDAEAAGTSQI
jgi:hypothetical protein